MRGLIYIEYVGWNEFIVSKGTPFDTMVTWNILPFFYAICKNV